MNNQKGFANTVLIVLVVILVGALGYVTLVKKSVPVEQSQSNNSQNMQTTTLPPSDNTVSPTPQANTAQMTKALVLNGFDQCSIQFNNGEISIGYDKYTELERTCSAAVSGASISADGIVIVDLDDDGINEALAPVRVVRASSGGALYAFKNVNGIARAVDSIIFGKQNGKVVSVDKNTVIVEVEVGMGYSAHQETYKFVNGKLVKQ